MAPRVPILMYHKVDRRNPRSKVPGHYVAPALFSRQMRALRVLKFESIKLSELFQDIKPMPVRPIVVTFDDGYENFSSNALPILKRHGFVSSVFLVANQIGGANRWDADRGDVEERLMGRDEIRRAEEFGTEFGSHTLDHADLTTVSPEEAWRQIADSKQVLDQILRSPVLTFCYPYGRKSPEVLKMVRQAGYRMACSTEKGANTVHTDRYALKRINVRSDTWTPVFLLKLLRTARHEA